MASVKNLPQIRKFAKIDEMNTYLQQSHNVIQDLLTDYNLYVRGKFDSASGHTHTGNKHDAPNIPAGAVVLNIEEDGTVKIANPSAINFTTGLDVASSGGKAVISVDITELQLASAAQLGILSAADWSTFNNKQPAGNYVVYTGATGNVDLGAYSITASALYLNFATGFTFNESALVNSGATTILFKQGTDTSGIEYYAGSAYNKGASFYMYGNDYTRTGGDNSLGGCLEFELGKAASEFHFLDHTSNVALMKLTDAGVLSLPKYTTDGFVKFTGSTGTLGVDTNTYLTAETDPIFLSAASAMSDPTGFTNRSGSAWTFTDGTRRFEVTVVSGSYDIWFSGVKHTISGTKYIDITDVEGLHYVYFDTDDILKEIVNADNGELLTLIREMCLVGIVYWDATNNVGVYVGEERHGIDMQGITHYNLHYTRGLQIVSGLSLGDFVIDSGSLDSHAQFSVGTGTIADEDIGLNISPIASTVGLPILCRDGALGNWRLLAQAGFACYQNPAGTTNRLMYNQLTGGAWQKTEVGEDNYVLYHIFVTTGKVKQMISIMGQAEYTRIADARNGATTEMGSLLLGNLPSPEIRPVGSIIYQTDKDYGNTINARIVLNSDGDEYVNWVTSELPRGVSPTDHGSLSGLADNDHPQYLLIDQTTPQTTVGTFTFPNIKDSGLTSGRIPYASTGGLLVDSANLTYNGTIFQVLGATYPVQRLTRTSTVTNSALDALGIEHKTTGDMTAGFGSGFRFEIQDLTGTTNPIASIYAIRETADNTGGLALRTFDSGTEYTRMYIKSSGNVGIGTTSPLGKLDAATGSAFALVVGGDVNAATRTDSTRKFARIGMPHYDLDEENILMFVLDSESNYSKVNIGGGSVSYNAATELSFITAANNTTLGGSTRMTIDATGNVGIGTAFPIATLDVRGVLLSTIVPFNQLSYDTATMAQDVGSGIGFGGSNSGIGNYSTFAGVRGQKENAVAGEYGGYLSLLTRANGGSVTEKMRITSSGNVGIGTTAPTAVLHIKAGTATASTAPIKLTSGTLLTSAEAGVIEFLTDDLYFTITTGAARKKIALADSSPIFTNLKLNGYIDILEGGATPTKYTRLQGGDQTIDLTYTLPTAYPTSSGQVLTSTDAGVMGWAAALTSALADGKIFMGNGAGVATAVTPSGDVTMSNTGINAIASDVIVNADIKSDAAIAISKLEAGVQPTGAIQMYGGSSAPAGWLLCDGASVSRTTYAALFAVIGTAFGTVDANTFNVPDMKDAFPRGTGTSTIFTDNTKSARSTSKTGGASSGIGSKQEDSLQGHKHNEWGNAGLGASGVSVGVNTGEQNQGTTTPVTDGSNGTPRTDIETRPKNIELNFIIKT